MDKDSYEFSCYNSNCQRRAFDNGGHLITAVANYATPFTETQIRRKSYLRAVLVLRTLASRRLCVLMLDLELDDLILKMFEQFLDTKSQPDARLSDMERIMTLIVEESEECSFELLSLLSISAEDLINTENEKTPARVAPKISGSTGNSRGKRKKGVTNTASQGDVEPKRKRALKKNETEGTGDAAEIHGEDSTPSKTDGIRSSPETRTEFPVLQLDAGLQKLGMSAPIGHATEQPGDGSEFSGAAKDQGEELVGRKIKVWWPSDDQKTERWEIVEYEEDSKATEDTRPPIVSSPSW
ncbi:hypothetical protein POM88_039538 [Heracleum sosnowskyi]|uniref:Uncharacterized protein n=1 Tax=Heracleum sosnowskyi TaxID=360622 RepID=A0AAD8M8X0_9APIA|nr:hypothetical protein POM88_039538 [Heracleum sosnowskyi]